MSAVAKAGIVAMVKPAKIFIQQQGDRQHPTRPSCRPHLLEAAEGML